MEQRKFVQNFRSGQPPGYSKKLSKSNLSSLRESRYEQEAAVCNGSDAGVMPNGGFDPSGDYDAAMKKSVSFRRKCLPTSLTTNGFGHGSQSAPPNKGSHNPEQTCKGQNNISTVSSQSVTSREASSSQDRPVDLRIRLDEDYLMQARDRGLGTRDHRLRMHDHGLETNDLGLADDFSEGVLMRATPSNSIAIMSPTSDNSQVTSASALSTSLEGSARINSPASSLLLSPDEAILAEQYFPVTFGAMAFSSYRSMGVTPTPGAWLVGNAASKKSSRSGSHRHGNRRPGSGQSSSSSNSKSSSIDRIYLMATDSPGNGFSTLLASTPYQEQLARLQMEQLRMEERRLQHLRIQEKDERRRGPVDRWYEMKTPQFHYEARKYNECLKCTDVYPKSPRL